MRIKLPHSDPGPRLVPQSGVLLWREWVESRHYASWSRTDTIGRFLGLNDLVPDGVADEVSRRSEVQLAHGRGAMRLNRLDADVERIGHLLVDAALRDQLDHLALATRQAAFA